jgi:glycosyltransferase involved in cell wall biosynthesis
VRVFPQINLWQTGVKGWNNWQQGLRNIPTNNVVAGVEVFYPRYTSLPRPIFHALWGFCAYPFVVRLLRDCYQQQPFDLIHAHYANPAGIIALLARRWLKIPVVLTIHGADIHYTAQQNRLGASIIRWVFRQVDMITANSQWTRKQIIELNGDPQKTEIVRLGANHPEKMVLTNPLPAPESEETITLLSVGYLRPLKGHAYVLKAISELTKKGYNIRYIVVGDGPEEANLRALTIQLGLSNIVSFEGYKSHQDVWAYFAACDIFVLPSWVEGFGLVYIEALSMGKPVIGCKGAGGPDDLHQLGQCIELVKPRDVNSLIHALQKLLDNPDQRRQMAEIGRQIVKNYYTWERNAQDTLAIYQKVLTS